MPRPDPRRQRLAVLKTYKLFIGGKFPRTESGRYKVATDPMNGDHLANYCHASRKDLRDAVVAARNALPGWRANSAYLRGQILYRAAEMMEARTDSLVAELRSSTGTSRTDALAEVGDAVDRLVHIAGWSDKFQQIFGSVNPVASSHFNFTTPEPCGVVGAVAPDRPSLVGLVSLVAPAIVAGNTVVALASQEFPLPAITLAEILATSDVPGGVVNILTGERAELATHFASHMDIDALVDGCGDDAIAEEFRRGAAANLKRVTVRPERSPRDWSAPAAQSPYRILDTVEFKTAWHPIGT